MRFKRTRNNYLLLEDPSPRFSLLIMIKLSDKGDSGFNFSSSSSSSSKISSSKAKGSLSNESLESTFCLSLLGSESERLPFRFVSLVSSWSEGRGLFLSMLFFSKGRFFWGVGKILLFD